MGIETVLILNSVALGLGIIFMTVLLVLLFKAERKLAKYGESKFFIRKK